MEPGKLLLLLLLGLAGQSSADSHPEVLQAPVGASILVQCHYRLQDVRARKVWCRFVQDSCQPLASSAVDRRIPASTRTFLTDLGGGLLQVEMVSLQEEDSGEYGCVVEGTMGPKTLHTVSLQVLPPVPGGEEEEETHKAVSLSEDASLEPAGSASPWELSWRENSMPLIWAAVLLLGLLLAAVVLFVMMARRKGKRHGVFGQSPRPGVSHVEPSSVAHHSGDSGLAAGLSTDVLYVRLDSPPSFDNTTYTSLPFDLPSRKPSGLPPQPSLPPKVLTSSKSVTYATVVFPGDRGGGTSCEPAQDPPNSQNPPS